MQMTQEAEELLQETLQMAMYGRYEYVMPEHLLYLLTYHFLFRKAFGYCGGDPELLRDQLGDFLTQSAQMPEEKEEPQFTEGMKTLLAIAREKARTGGRQEVDVIHLVYAFFRQEESFGVYYMRVQGVECVDLIAQMAALYGEEEKGTKVGETNPEKEPEDPAENDWHEPEAGEGDVQDGNCPQKIGSGKGQPTWQRR